MLEFIAININQQHTPAILPPVANPALLITAGNGKNTLIYSVAAGATPVIRRATNVGMSANVVTLVLTGSPFEDTGLTNGTTYYYDIHATKAGNSDSAYVYANATPSAVDTSVYVPFYIFASQSNGGWGGVAGITDQARFAGAKTYAKLFNPVTEGFSSNWYDMTPGANTAAMNYMIPTSGGHEISFATRMQEKSPKERWYYKQSQGNTYLAAKGGGGNSWEPGSPLYLHGSSWATFVECLTRACMLANQAGKVLQLRGFIWTQGENDTLTETDASAYLGNLNGFFNAVNGLLTSLANDYDHDFPLTYKKIINRNSNSAAWPYRAAVRQAQADFCANPANNAVLKDCDAIPLAGDDQHYTIDGQMTIGLNAAEEFDNEAD